MDAMLPADPPSETQDIHDGALNIRGYGFRGRKSYLREAMRVPSKLLLRWFPRNYKVFVWTVDWLIHVVDWFHTLMYLTSKATTLTGAPSRLLFGLGPCSDRLLPPP